jgi:hypothetical protein
MPKMGLRLSCSSSLSLNNRNRRSCGVSETAGTAEAGLDACAAAGADDKPDSATTAADAAKTNFNFIIYPFVVARDARSRYRPRRKGVATARNAPSTNG